MNPKFSAYANPDALVDTDWLAANLNAPSIRIVESNEDLLLYDTGHIPGAVHIDWRRDHAIHRRAGNEGTGDQQR